MDNFGENDEKSSSKRNDTNVEQSMVNWLIVNKLVLMSHDFWRKVICHPQVN